MRLFIVAPLVSWAFVSVPSFVIQNIDPFLVCNHLAEEERDG